MQNASPLRPDERANLSLVTIDVEVPTVLFFGHSNGGSTEALRDRTALAN
jgi:hypothetical protein